MLFDLQKDNSELNGRSYDFCICGTGPAGITVARDLARVGKRVILIEAGGLDYSDQSQDVYGGSVSGIPSYEIGMKGARLRYFGGTSNHWAGMCGVFQESDFLMTESNGLPGWPIGRANVFKYLNEAANILDLGSTDFSNQVLDASINSSFERPAIAYSAPTRFGTKYRDEIVNSKNIDLFINANAVDVHLASSNGALPSIEYLSVQNYRKESSKIFAKHYVLAMGSIENARFLLNANKQMPTGIGNHSDFLGRCFMEHLNVQIGKFVTRSQQKIVAGELLLSPTVKTMRKLKIGNGILDLQPNADAGKHGGRLGPIRDLLNSLACRSITLREFSEKFVNFNCDGDGVISSLIEQVPNRNSRVSLGKGIDVLGKKRAHLHWVLSDVDRRTIRTLGFELAKNFLDFDLGRVQLSKFIVDPSLEIELIGHAHQMGTTRMSNDPNYGVVNSDCRVYGVNNLYISGSSVFPTGGGINPTLTIVMLSLRLGEHLRSLA